MAASALIEISHIHESALLVGHGVIDYLIAKELLSRNWVGPKKPGGGYWEYGVYRPGVEVCSPFCALRANDPGSTLSMLRLGTLFKPFAAAHLTRRNAV